MNLDPEDEYLIGIWKFDQIPDHVDMDDEVYERGIKKHSETTVSFEVKRYSISIEGDTETGTWKKISNSFYKFNSNQCASQEVTIIRVSENQVNF